MEGGDDDDGRRNRPTRQQQLAGSPSLVDSRPQRLLHRKHSPTTKTSRSSSSSSSSFHDCRETHGRRHDSRRRRRRPRPPSHRMTVGLVGLSALATLAVFFVGRGLHVHQHDVPVMSTTKTMTAPRSATAAASVVTSTDISDRRDGVHHSPFYPESTEISSSFLFPRATPYRCSMTATKTVDPPTTHNDVNASAATTTTTTTTTTTAAATPATAASVEVVTLPLKCPHFIIAGAQKSGTTALSECLSHHPLLRPSVTAETHFFDWHYPWTIKDRVAFETKYNLSLSSGNKNNTTTTTMPGTMTNTMTESDRCAIRTAYVNGSFDFSNGTRFLFFEKTPSYLFLGHVPGLVHDLCNNDGNDGNGIGDGGSTTMTKIIVLLRNPIDRAYSHFAMKIRTNGRSFEHMVDEEVNSLRRLGLSNAPTLQEYRLLSTREANGGTTSPSSASLDVRFDIPSRVLHRWTNEERRTKFRKHYRTVFAGNYLQRGLYREHLEPWLDNNRFRLNETLLVLQHESFLRYPKRTYRRVLDFVGVPRGRRHHGDGADDGYFIPHDKVFATRYNAHPAGRPPMDGVTREYLAKFFRPHNDRLAELLGVDNDPSWQWERW